MRIALTSQHLYLCAENGGDSQGLVHANRPEAGAWETFTVEPQPDGTLAFKTINGKYLCAEGGGGSEVHANRPAVGEWERWHPSAPLTDQAFISLQATDELHYLSVNPDPDRTVAARATLPILFQVQMIEAGPPLPVPGDVRRLVSVDRPTHTFVNEDGVKVKLRGASEFLLFKRFLDGEDIDPQLRQLQEEGVNLLRVMGMFESLGGFNPKAYPAYYSQICAFMERCRLFGHYVLWTACAATGGVFTEDEAIEHIKKTVEELKQTVNAIFSPVNEQGQHNNSISIAKYLSRVDMGWILHDNGSYGSDIPCPPPLGHWAPLHIRRVFPALIKDNCVVDHPNYPSVEVALDEPARYGEEGSGDGHDNPARCADAAGTAYTALFWVFHSMQGERAEVLRGNTLDCLRAAMGAMKGT